jgi:hypothetical protein
MVRIIKIMRYILPIILTFFFRLSFAQNSNKVETDSSFIETKYFPSLNSIRVFNRLKGKDKTYYTDLYYRTRKLKEQDIFVNGYPIGVSKEFFENGNLKREIDYDNGIIIYFDKKTYPFLEYQNSCKLKGDSVIKSIYSTDFFNRYISWDISRSYMYNEQESKSWTDEIKNQPTKFLLRYNVKFDEVIYPGLIEFEIDSKGKFIPNPYESIYGFEKLSENTSKTFALDRNKAIALAKQHGLRETDSTKAEAFLDWESFKSDSMYNGKFLFSVIIKTSSNKNISPGGRSSITDKFDAYIFNPWTAEFIEKKKMKTIRSWEKMSGNSTALLPDNE